MGQFRFWIGFVRGFGFSVVYYRQLEIEVQFLFFKAAIGLTEHAHGYNFFDKWYSTD